MTGKEHKRTHGGLEILIWVVVTQVSAYVKVHWSGSLGLSSLLYVWDISIGRQKIMQYHHSPASEFLISYCFMCPPRGPSHGLTQPPKSDFLLSFCSQCCHHYASNYSVSTPQSHLIHMPPLLPFCLSQLSKTHKRKWSYGYTRL